MKKFLVLSILVVGLALLVASCAGMASAGSTTTSSTSTSAGQGSTTSSSDLGTGTTTIDQSSPTTAPGQSTDTTTLDTSSTLPATSTTLTNTQVARPTVTAVSPRSGPTAGGNVVTITGTGFTGATSVRFGTVTTTHFTVKSSTKITVTVPAQAAGIHDVNVTTPGGRSVSNSVDKYTYVAQVARPTVTAVSPRSGPTAGGNVVTITGTGFTGATSVRFGTVTTTHFTVKSSTRITVTVPSQKSAGIHDVNVTTPGGRSVSNSVDKYTYK